MPTPRTPRSPKSRRRPTRPPGLGELLSQTIGDANALMKAEVDLAKAELRASTEHLKRAAVLLAAVSVVALAGFTLLLHAAAMGLATLVPAWAAYLLVAAATVGVGGVLTWRAVERLELIEPAPNLAIENTKEDVECIVEVINEPPNSNVKSSAVAPA